MKINRNGQEKKLSYKVIKIAIVASKMKIAIGIFLGIATLLPFYFGIKNFSEVKDFFLNINCLLPLCFGFILGGIIVAIGLYLVIRNLLNKKQTLEERLKTSHFINGVPAQSLLAHREHRRQREIINPVQLDLYEIKVRVVGDISGRKDADVTYYFEGTNISNKTLHELKLTIAGDNVVSLDDLNCHVYDLTKNSKNDRSELAADLDKEAPDTIYKDIFLRFLHPGIKKNKSFKLEFQFLWPGIFNIKEDFWFLDNIGFKGETEKIKLSVKFVTLDVEAVRAYELECDSLLPRFIGMLSPSAEEPNTYSLERKPKKDAYYIIFFKGNTKKATNVTQNPQSNQKILKLISLAMVS